MKETIHKTECQRCGSKYGLMTIHTEELKDNIVKYKICHDCRNMRQIKYPITKKIRKSIRISAVKWRKNNRLKYLAHSKIQHHRLFGKLIKANCVLCGNTDSVAHHTDYSQPLLVVWLCRNHHNKIHSVIREIKEIVGIK